MCAFGNYEDDNVVRFKKAKPGKLETGNNRLEGERPTIRIKGNHQTPDELAKDIAKALKKDGYKQQAKSFKSDADAVLENESATDSDVMKVAARHCICNYSYN